MSDIGIGWDAIAQRVDELNTLLSASIIEGKRHLLQKELSFLSTLLNKHKEIQALQAESHALEAQRAQTADQEMQQLFDEELETIATAVVKEQQALDKIMYPPDPRDRDQCF